jgi:hypothetical protein
MDLFTRFRSSKTTNLTPQDQVPMRHAQLSVSIDDGFYEHPAGLSLPRERYTADRMDLLRQSLEAWQSNPLARRVVELTSQYVVGGGISLTSPQPTVSQFLQSWWSHPLNNLDIRCTEWCDELTRSGELFIVLSSDPAGMTYVRAVPAARIQSIQAIENDLEQELAYQEYPAPEKWKDGAGPPGKNRLRGVKRCPSNR